MPYSLVPTTMSALAKLEAQMSSGGRNSGGNRDDRNRNNRGSTNSRDASGNSRWNERRDNRGSGGRSDGGGGGGGRRGMGDFGGGGNVGRRDMTRPQQRTNSRWDLQEENGAHGKIAKTASKESLKKTWGQIRAARQAKLAAAAETQGSAETQSQKDRPPVTSSGLGNMSNRSGFGGGHRGGGGQSNRRGQGGGGGGGDDTRRSTSSASHIVPAVEVAHEPEGPPPYEPPETVQLREYFSERSSVFRAWEKTRGDGWTNKNVANFFDKKKGGHDKEREKGKKGHGTDMRRIGQLFNRFYDYAHDINSGTNYAERALQMCQVTGSCDFLDFGFAPGGMSHLLLSKHKGMRGSGVTLDPKQGGNVWPDWLDRDPRFFSCVGDVVDMAKDEVNLPQMLQLPKDDFEGFDFVIVSILFFFFFKFF